MKSIEIFILWEDYTWTTELVEVPTSVEDENSFQLWVIQNLHGLNKYRKAIQFGIYSLEYEEDSSK